MFYKIDKFAVKPKRATRGSAGLDLFAVEEGIIPIRGRKAFRTGLKVVLPEGTYGRIASRSGLALFNGIDVAAGVIDSDYRGELKILLCNNSDMEFRVRFGMKIAQFIVEKIKVVEPEMSENLDQILNTERNDKGFGSSGIA
jgi:dUTP pyrophosphatase